MIRDDFAGPGGWEEGANLIGLGDIIGIEHDRAACQTATAAGHRRILADVTTLPLKRWGGLDGYIASPPCTAFSAAGARKGIDVLPLILAAVDGTFTGDKKPRRALAEACQDPTALLVLEPARIIRGLRPPWVALEQVPPVLPIWERITYHLRDRGYSAWCGILNAADFGVPQTRRRAILIASRILAVGPPTPTHGESPGLGLFDQLLPWVSMAAALGWGMSDRTYPTIAPGHNGAAAVGGSGARRGLYNERAAGRWLDTADPTDLEVDFPGGAKHATRRGDEPAATIAFGHDIGALVVRTGNNSHVTSREGSKNGEGGVELYERSITEPAPTLARKVGAAWRVIGVNTGRDWKAGGTREDAQIVDPDGPAPIIDGKGRWHALLEQAPWAEDRPATTIAGDSRLWPPGHKINADDVARLGLEEATERYGDRAGTDAIRLGIDEALILQSFRADYPVVGTKTKKFEQVGNAIPPLLAAHVLAAATGLNPPKGTP